MSNSDFEIENGVLKKHNGTGGDVVIPDGVTTIGEKAFDFCSRLTSVVIPNSVTSIGDYAFSYCSMLTSVTIPDSVTSIGDYAFSGCSGLTSIAIPNSVTSIGESAFDSCTGLTSIAIPNSVISIGEWAFRGCTGLTSISIPDSITSIKEGVLAGCSGLTSITIPNSVTSIGDAAFEDCTGLTSISIPESVLEIGEETFSNCIELTNITFGNGVTSIGDVAFDNCTGLKSVSIPGSVKSIGTAAFCCGSLKSIDVDKNNPIYHSEGNCLIETESKTLIAGCETSIIPDDGTVTGIGCCAFSGCSGLKDLTIPDGVTSIGFRAFSECGELQRIIIPDSVIEIEKEAFYNSENYFIKCNEGSFAYKYAIENNIPTDEALRMIKTNNSVNKAESNITSSEKENSDFDIENGVLKDYNGKGGDVVIPDGVTSIGEDTFWSCAGLTSIIIPNSVTSIGKEAFSKCTGLTSITIPNSVTEIGEEAFSQCTGLTSITIPDSVKSIGNAVFGECTGLISATIGNGVTSISKWLFSDCTELTSITIPASVTSIGDMAFQNCARLTNITIPDSVTNIGKSAFECCESLESITIPDGVTSIGKDTFWNCTGLTSITIPDSVMEIDEKIFISCDNLAIKCNKGSYAYNYAVKNDIPIEILPGRKRIIKDVVTKKGGLILTNCIEAGPGLFGGKSFRPKCPNCGYESQNTFCATGTGEMSNNIMCRSCGKEYTTTIKAAVNVSYDKGNTVVAGRDWVIAVPDGYHSTCEGIGPNENWCYIVPCDYDLNKDHTQAKPFSFGVGKLNAFGSTLLPNPDSRSISYSNMIKFILNNYGAFNDTNPDNVNEYVINDNCVAFYYSGFNENDPTWIKIKGFICAGSDVRQFHLFRNYDESILDEVEDEYKLLLDVMVKWFDKTKYTGNIVFSD